MFIMKKLLVLALLLGAMTLDFCRGEEDIGNIDKILQELQAMAGPYAKPPAWMDATSFTFGKTTYLRSAGLDEIEIGGGGQQQRHQEQEQLFQVSPIMYNALDYEGRSTKVFAWLSLPIDTEGTETRPFEEESSAPFFQPFTGLPVPAVVLVHGRGGTAYKKWAGHWAWKGYASIVIAHEGQTDVVLEDDAWASVQPDNAFQKHGWPGPGPNDQREMLRDQWMYHALADTILAHSLLRSFWDRVDVNKVGIMGMGEEGAAIASNAVAGLDTRFSYMMASYYYGEDVGGNTVSQTQNRFFVRGADATFVSVNDRENELAVWDPKNRLDRVQVPTFWSVVWPQAKAESSLYPMEQIGHTCNALVNKPYMTSFVLEGAERSYEGHPSRETVIWARPESYNFANSVIEHKNEHEDIWAREIHTSYSPLKADNGVLHIVIFDTAKPIRDAQLVYLSNEEGSTRGQWIVIPARLEQLDCHQQIARCHWKVIAEVPDAVQSWYFNMYTRDGGLNLSSNFYNRALLRETRRRERRRRGRRLRRTVSK
jgi:hypothetical protein